MAVQHITSDLIVKGVMECCISNVMVGTNDDSRERIAMFGVSVRKMKAVTLIGRDR